MAFRTLEITKPSEIHIKNGQLEITQDENVVLIPIEDLSQIMTIGPNIRLSTLDISILTQSKVCIMTLDNKYLPTAIILPFEGNSRQSQLMHQQIAKSNAFYENIWLQIIDKKISNQARCLSILGLAGSELITTYKESLTTDNIDYNEALAAKEYFQYFHEGLNRRNDDPVNSRLNYGYAVIRSAIARAVVSVGFHPAFGIHHNNQLNAFNLVDDLIEPFRPMVDLVAHENIGTNEKLNKSERQALAHVLHNACIIGGTRVNILSAIDIMCESIKRCMSDDSEMSILLPTILPIEDMEAITE